MAIQEPESILPTRELAALTRNELQRVGSPCPPIGEVVQILDTLFFTSLKTDEGRFLSCSIHYLSQSNPDPFPPKGVRNNYWSCTCLERPIPLTVSSLARIANAVDPKVCSLAVCPDVSGQLVIWGIIDQAPFSYSSWVTRRSSLGPVLPGEFWAITRAVGEVSVYRDYFLIATGRHNTVMSTFHDVLHAGAVLDKLKRPIREYYGRVSAAVGKVIWEANGVAEAAGLTHQYLDCIARLLIEIRKYRHGGAVLMLPTTQEPHLKVNYRLKYDRLQGALTRFGEAMVKWRYFTALDQDSN